MGQYIVYADILLALNFFCDFFLLWTAGRIAGRKISLLRCFLAAAAGAAYGLTAVYPALNWLTNPFCVLTVSLLLLRIAYQWKDPLSFIKLAGIFYLAAFTLAGAALAGERLLEHNGIILAPIQTFKAGSLLFALFIGLILGKRSINLLRRSLHKDDFRFHITISVGGKSCRLQALLDTGNDLLEPISGLPVAVANYQAIRSLFPEYLKRAIEDEHSDDPGAIIHSMAEQGRSGWLKKLRLIPYASIGQSNGLMLGFRPDELIIEGKFRQKTAQVMICITKEDLGNGNQAIVNPEIISGGEKCKEVSCA